MEAAEIFSPPGIEGELRELDRLSDGGMRPLTLEEVNAVSVRYGTRYCEVEA